MYFIYMNKLTNSLLLPVILSVLPLVVHCGEQPPTDVLADGCQYTYDPATTELKWTAFKFTDRVGVGGTFDEYQVSGTEADATSPQAAVRNLKFSIQGPSVNSDNPERDAKIAGSYFGLMENTGTIEGSVKSAGADEGVVTILMNGVEKDIPVTVEMSGVSQMKVSGNIDVNDFNAQESVQKLNEVCSEKHTGEDGASKLWPDVDFTITTTFKRDCPDSIETN
ncbi:MAG: YceI family protein [Leptospiraceae bacterium]|nr:YceI family protein [Leptospiraceae bacterium]